MADQDVIYEFICDLEKETFNKPVFDHCFAACLALYHNYSLVAVSDEKVVGYISCHGQILLHHLGLVYEIQEIYVLPEFRGNGVGRQLLSALQSIIDQTDYQLLEVCAKMTRTEAQQFYLNNGFSKTSFKFGKQRS